MLAIFCQIAAAASLITGADDVTSNDFVFADPVRIEAGGEPIDVTTGHAAPYLYDMDGDGFRDLLVGEFGAEPYDGPASDPDGWVQGRLRIYKNHGTNQAPKYESFEYMKAGDKFAAVPITCCVRFVPHVVDFDDDGIDDIISGSYPGDMYFFKRRPDGSFENVRHLLNVDGKPLLVISGGNRLWVPKVVDGKPLVATQEIPWAKESYRLMSELRVHSVTVEAHDMDGDDDLDLVVGSRSSGCYVIENIGSRSEPVWDSTSWRLMTSSGDRIGSWDYGSNVHFTDWDKDGISDILVGSENGGVYWHRNEGSENIPVFGAQQTLIPELTTEQMFHRQTDASIHGSRAKVHAADYNNDGYTDLLIGDYGSTWHHVRTLTEQEKQEKEELEQEETELLTSLEDVILKGEENRTTDEQAQIDWIKQVNERLGELETHRIDSHGWVWFYAQEPPATTPSATADAPEWTAIGSPGEKMQFLLNGSSIQSSSVSKVGLQVTVPRNTTVGGHIDHGNNYPSTLTWDLPDGFRVQGITWPKTKTMTIAGISSDVYDKTFSIWAEIQTPSDITPHTDYVLQATLRYQTCSKRTGVCTLETNTARASVHGAAQRKELQ